jgi:hypothetical protein
MHGAGVLLKWQRACLASARLCIQNLSTTKKNICMQIYGKQRLIIMRPCWFVGFCVTVQIVLKGLVRAPEHNIVICTIELFYINGQKLKY